MTGSETVQIALNQLRKSEPDPFTLKQSHPPVSQIQDSILELTTKHYHLTLERDIIKYSTFNSNFIFTY